MMNLIIVFIGVIFHFYANAQDDPRISASQKLCSTSGTSSDVKIVGTGEASTSKVVAQLVGAGGKVTGTVEFTRAEWNGIEAFRHDAPSYLKCVDMVTARFKKKDDSL